MEERKRKGRVLSLWSSASPSGVTVGRKGRKHVLAEGTGSVPRGHHTPPAHTPLTAARTCLWLGSGCSVHRWKCQPFGIWGFGHQGPAAKVSPIAKALPPMPHPTAVFKHTPALSSSPVLPCPRDGSGPAPPQPAREPLGTSVGVRNCTLPFQIHLHARLSQTPLHLLLPLSGGGGDPSTHMPQFTLDTAVATSASDTAP